MNSLSMLYRSFYTRMKIRNSWRRNCSIREQKGGIAGEKYLILTPWARRKTFPDRSVSWLRRNEFLYRVASCFSGWMPSRGHTGTGGNGQSRRQRRRFCAEDGRTDGRWTRALSSLGPVSPSFSIERSQWMPIHWCVVGWFDEAWWMLLESRDSARTERAKSRLKSATRAVRLFPGPVRPTIQTIAAPIVCIGTHCTPLSQSRLSLSLSLSIELEIPDGEPISPLDPPGPGFLSTDWSLQHWGMPRTLCRGRVETRQFLSLQGGIWFEREGRNFNPLWKFEFGREIKIRSTVRYVYIYMMLKRVLGFRWVDEEWR